MVSIPESGTQSGPPAILLDPQDPAADPILKNSAIRPILKVLTRDRGRWYNLTELFDAAEVTSRDNAQRAIDALLEAGWIEERREGNARLIRIQDDRIAKGDPLLRISKPYRDVIRWFLGNLDEAVGEGIITHVVVFGSVVGDTADRLSDIDLLIVTTNDRQVRRQGRRLAHELATDSPLGDRYEIDLHVETPTSLPQRTADPQFPEMIRRGILVREPHDQPLDDLLPEAPG